MASTYILSDNGVSSGSAGVKSTGGNDGVLILQTTTAGGTATNALTIDASQNVGIGTSSPTNIAGYKSVTVSSTTGGWLEVTNGTVRGALQNGSGDVTLETRSAHPLIFGINGAEKARIDSSGNLLVGTTSSIGKLTVTGGGANVYATQSSASGYNYNSNAANASGTYYHFAFYAAGTYVGEIRSSNTTTTYATASDYRLKEDIRPMTGALAKVAALKPVTYKWKADGSAGEGFIAHELAEICPDAVTGTKDAVDAEGKPVYQGIDVSFLVATLTAAIQEQQTIIEQLRADVAELKSKA